MEPEKEVLRLGRLHLDMVWYSVVDGQFHYTSPIGGQVKDRPSSRVGPWLKIPDTGVTPLIKQQLEEDLKDG